MYVPNLLFLLLVRISITCGIRKQCFDDSHKPIELYPREERINELLNPDIPVWISRSDTDTQKIIPRILRLYFTEVLGLHNVTVTNRYELEERDDRYVAMHMERSYEFGAASDFSDKSTAYRSYPIELVRWKGWFVPSEFSNHTNWWQFKDPGFARRHPIDREVMKNLTNIGSFVPDWCLVSRCTIMIADSLDATAKRQISEEKLYIQLYSSADIIKSLLESSPKMFFIYLGTYPGPYTYGRKHFQLIDSPPNDLLPTRSTVFRDEDEVFVTYDGSGSKNKLLMILMRTIESYPQSSPPFGSLMRHACFSSEEYLQFIGTNTEDEFDVACEWLKKNENRTIRWLQKPRRRLIIGVVLPTELQLYYDASIFEILALVREALDEKKFSRNYQILSLLPKTDDDPRLQTSQDSYDRVIGIVRPGWSSEKSTRNQGIAIVSYDRMIASAAIYKYIYAKFLVRFDWRRVAIIGNHFVGLGNTFLDNNISVVSTLMITRESKYEEIEETLRDLVQKRIKIIIVDESMESLYGILCAAFHLNMTAKQGYVWSLSGLFPDKWWRREFRSKDGNILCTFDQLLSVINGHFSVAQVNYGDDEQIMQEGIQIGEWRKKKSLGHYAGFLYDACWTFIDAANRLEGKTPQVLEYIRRPSAERFQKTISETDFYGVSGRVRFDGNGSRMAEFRIQQFINGSYRRVGNFRDGILEMDEVAIVWMTGSVPTDGREPSAKSLNVSWVVISSSLLILVLLSVIIVVGFFFFKKRYNKKLLEAQRLPKYQLDEWELPRNEVVMERQIGEGAFGKVYGGQVLLPEKGWLPVAIKTLKVGCSMLEKSDFLSEVEAMKSFDHPNLIKLIGVCLKTEPVLAVMEFMVHGDLKSYLQAREETPDEIGSDRLTRMALDVIKALNYLDELKYVHRDVAARNCLVDSDLVVKLSDFGMSRSLYENDYYRFDRRGLFPVRWMAVESLDSGVFTPKSDIWSFGILLYEIITYGGTPYHGKTNEEVVQYLKSGKVLSIPEAVTQTLEKLMNSCWKLDPKERPTAGEIISILEANPNLLEPCSSVQDLPMDQ